MNLIALNKKRNRRSFRVRKKIHGTALRPRLSIFFSNYNAYIQVINDDNSETICSVSTLSKEFRESYNGGSVNLVAIEYLAEILVKKLKEKSILQLVLDRGYLSFHGKVKKIAEVILASDIKV